MVDEIKHSIDTSNNISVETLKIHLHNKQIRMGPMLMGSRATARRAHALRRHCIDYLSNISKCHVHAFLKEVYGRCCITSEVSGECRNRRGIPRG